MTEDDLELDNYKRAEQQFGLRDDLNAAGQPGSNGIPDVAYVTGTGAHDRITLTLTAPGTVTVLVQAYSNPAKTAGFLIGTHSYTINLATETDGPIWVDPSLGDDEVIADPAITADTVNPSAQVAELGDAPQVAGVVMKRSTGQHPDWRIPAGSGDQIKTVPVGGMNRITIEFDERVTAANANVLSLEGLFTGTTNYVAQYPVTLTGNGTRELTWTFDAPFTFTTDQIVLRLDAANIKDDRNMTLDGEWTNPYAVADKTSSVSTFPSGNGVQGGNFEFFFTALYGDLNRSNQVSVTDDILPALSYIGVPGPLYWGQGDFNGDNTVGITLDVSPALANIGVAFFAEWPGGQQLMGGGEFAGYGSNESDDIATFRALMEKHGVTVDGDVVESVTATQWNAFVDDVFETFDYDSLALTA